jgi:hypothetical protein
MRTIGSQRAGAEGIVPPRGAEPTTHRTVTSHIRTACPLHMATSMSTRGSRARSRGISAVELLLATTLVMGTFVYRFSRDVRDTGKEDANSYERGHDRMLQQAQAR